jgi:hypothetical protein
MAITITADDVKRKAMVNSSTYDTSITSLIAEMQAPLQYSIADIYLSDTANTYLQTTLKLGILEIITGEFLEQLRREAGATENFSAGGITIGSSSVRGVDLIQQGASRLAPYLKSTLPMMSESTEGSTTLDVDMHFSVNEEVW